MNINHAKVETAKYSIKDLLNSNFRIKSVLESNEINYGYDGDKTLLDVCKENGLDFAKISSEIKDHLNNHDDDQEKFNDWDLKKLIEFLKNDHNSFVKKHAISLTINLEKIAANWGREYPEIRKIEFLFSELLKDFLNHLNNEEKFLFHVINYLVDCKKFDEKPRVGGFKTVQNPILKNEEDHKKSKITVNKINDLIKELESKKDLPELIQSTIEEFKSFGKSLQFHVHLENNILFPKAIELENSLLQK